MVSFFFFCRIKDGTMDLFFFQAEDGIRDRNVTGVQTCALPISRARDELAHTRDRNRQRMRNADRRRRSEERRVGKECRSRWSPYHSQKNKRAHGVERGAAVRYRLAETHPCGASAR